MNIRAIKLLAFSGVFLFFLFVGSPKAFAACGDSITGGSGTVGSPYLISTPTELAAISNCLGGGNASKYFLLDSNIDLNVSPYNTGTVGLQSEQVATVSMESLMGIFILFLICISTAPALTMLDSLGMFQVGPQFQILFCKTRQPLVITVLEH